MRKEKKIFWLVLISFFLLLCVSGAQVNASVAMSSDVVLVEEKQSTAQEATDAASSGSIEVDQTVARSFEGNLSGTIQGGHQQMLQPSSGSNSASFSRHMMCKDYKVVPSFPPRYDPIDPTTIFSPSDAKAVCLTTVSVNDTIEFRWHYRSNSSKTWVSCYNFSKSFSVPGKYHYAAWLLIAGYWPGTYYPRAYEVEVYLDGSSSPSFSEFFEVTNGGLNSPRICEDFDVNGNPVNVKSRFTIGADTKAHHYLRFDKIAYFNEELGYCHNFTTVWIQPNGSAYKTYSDSFSDYKDADVTWNYWEYRYARYDYIFINLSTPVGNWKVEVYLDSYFNNTWMRYGPVATTPFVVGSEPVTDWTFMVYLDADNTLENASIEVFSNMAKVGSSSQVNIVVQMDRHPDPDIGPGNWTDCKRFNVTEGMTPTPENAVEELGEVNMGDPSTLKDFVNWTISNYPANYYFLVLWDHGTGCMGFCFDVTNETDFLSLPELSQALSGLPAIMDVVLIDACSMSMTEVACQIKDCANVLVGPEGLGYAPAPYDDYLSSLTNNPSMSPRAFTREVVTNYINWCKGIGEIRNATMSATDLTKITSLIAATDDFALKLKKNENFYNYLINLARNLTEGYLGPIAYQSGYYIDLYHFAQLINQSVLDEEIQNAADQVMTTLESIIIIEADKIRPDSHGLSIFFPDEKGKYDSFGSVYEKTTFAEDTSWDEFVKYYLYIQTYGYILTIQTPYPELPVSVNDESCTTDAEGKLRVFILPDSYTVNVPTPVLIGPGSRGVFTQWNDYKTNPSRTITVTGPATYTAYYKTQYEVAFSQSGVGTDFTETVVTIDETEYGVDNLPVSFWWDNGTTHTFAFQSPLVVAPNDKQYAWNSTGGLSSLRSDSINVSISGSVIGNYKTQYYLKTSTNFGTVNPSSGWHDAGSTVQISASAPDVLDGERYLWLGWTRSGNGSYTGMDNPATITMNSPITERASWQHQYRLIMDTNFGTTNPSAGEHWYEANSTVEISATAQNATSGERYVWLGWTGTGSGNYSGSENLSEIQMNTPITEVASWKVQYYLTVNSVYGTPSGAGWYDGGSTAYATLEAEMVDGTTGIRYVFTQWSDDASGTNYAQSDSIITDAPKTATADWKTQYYLTIDTDPTGLSPQPNISIAGPWYDSGTQVNLTAETIEDYKFDHWDIDGTAQDANSISLTMDRPYEVTARYMRLAWWETLLRPEKLVILGLVGIVSTVTLVGTALVIIRRRRAIMKAPAEPVPIEVSEVLPDRIPTGSAALDNLLFGGIPENYAVVLTSPSCDERDLLIKRFLENGAKKGEVTFYVTTDPGEVKSLVEEFQSNFYLFVCNPQADKIIKSLPNVFKIKGVENLTDLSIALTKAFRRIDESTTGPKRACIAIISDVLLQHHAVQTRRWLTDIITELKSRGFTTLAVVNPKMHPSEEVHAILDLFEGEINIYERAREERFLKIKKMYNQRYSESELPLKKEKPKK